MATWDPKSYVSEAVGTSQRRGSNRGYALSYFDYTTSDLRRREVSDEIKQELLNEYASIKSAGGSVAGLDFSVFYFDEVDQSPALNALCTNYESEESGINIVDEFRNQVNSICGELGIYSEEGLPSQLLKECAVVEIVARLCSACDPFSNSLIVCGGVSLAPGGSWGLGVPASGMHLDEELFSKLIHVGGDNTCSLIWRQYLGDQTARLSYTLTGKSLGALCAFQSCISGCETHAAILDAGSKYKGNENFGAFFCSGSDGFEYCSQEEDIPEQADYMSWHDSDAHSLRAVKTGNSADAFHLLEGKPKWNLLHSVLDFINSVAQVRAMLSCSLSTGQIFSQSITFQLFAPQRQCGCFSVQQCSPLYNYIFMEGSRMVVSFSQSDKGDFSGRLWSNGESCLRFTVDDFTCCIPPELSQHTHYVFTTNCATLIGDCTIVIGQLHAVFEPQTVFCKGNIQHKLSPRAFLVTPVLCSMIHRSYGLVAFVSYGCFCSSHFPPTLTLSTTSENLGMPLSETDIDPNFTLYLFDEFSSYFRSTSFSSLVERLPFPVSRLSTVEKENFSFILRARLVNLIPVTEASTALCVVSVSEVERFSGRVLLSLCTENSS